MLKYGYSIFFIALLIFFIHMSKLQLFICLLLMVYCTGCSRYYYKPNGANAPLLTDAKQLHLAGSVERGGDGPMVDAQAAWSPVKHLGIIADLSTFRHSEDSPDVPSGKVSASASMAEAGAGYYYAADYYNKQGGKLSLVFDVYGGPGIGRLKSDINTGFTRLFVQPGLGVRTKFAEVSFNWRISDIHYFRFDANGHDDNYLRQQNLITGTGRRIDHGSYVFSEPSVTLRAGYKLVKLQVQFVWANSWSNVPWNYNNSMVNIGLAFKTEEWKELFHKKVKH